MSVPTPRDVQARAPRTATLPDLADAEADERFKVLLAILPYARDRAIEYAEWVLYADDEEDES